MTQTLFSPSSIPPAPGLLLLLLPKPRPPNRPLSMPRTQYSDPAQTAAQTVEISLHSEISPVQVSYEEMLRGTH